MKDELYKKLKQHWNVEEFRPQQYEICQSILSKRDCLVLLPTGGGKSLCYQLPALLFKGPVLVISPLISLMQDQVAQANARGIKSMAIGSQQQLDQQLDNATYGNYKLIYCSPEKLQNKQLIERLAQINIQCIAVDEAHCISQWGNDFRPAFLKIKSLRTILQDVPMLALTASATPKVIEDITASLALKECLLFKSSFERKNIALIQLHESDKLGSIYRAIEKEKNASIVYCSSRKETEQIQRFLSAKGLQVDFFHGGLNDTEKKDKLLAWQRNQVPTMIATNAFGMGIDKEDVGTVLHLNLPSSLEYYYQEVGRAGRNGRTAKAILLYQVQDEERLKKQFLSQLPSKDLLQKCYKYLCNYLNIGYGEGFEESWEFSFSAFCNTYNLNPNLVAACFRLFDQANIFQQIQSNRLKASLQLICSVKHFKQEIENTPTGASNLLQTIARLYPGIFENEISVNIDRLVEKSQLTFSNVLQILTNYHEQKFLHFSYANYDLKLVGQAPREDEYTLRPLLKDLQTLHRVKKEKIDAILDFAQNNDDCKQRQLLAYFGEVLNEDCGNCSSKSCNSEKNVDAEALEQEIKFLLQNKALSAHELKLSLIDYDSVAIGQVLEELELAGKVKKNKFDQFKIA